MPRLPNPLWTSPSDPWWGPGSPTLSNESDDGYNQPRWGGVGQGLPVDENRRYIRNFQVASLSPSPTPGAGGVDPPADERSNSSVPVPLSPAVELGPVANENPPHQGHTYAAVVTVPECTSAISRTSVKRRLDDIFSDSLPQTPSPRRSLYNTPIRARTMQSAPVLKRRRLQAPFDIHNRSEGPHTMQNLEKTVKEMQQALSASLTKQTEVLLEILKAMQAQDSDSMADLN